MDDQRQHSGGADETPNETPPELLTTSDGAETTAAAGADDTNGHDAGEMTGGEASQATPATSDRRDTSAAMTPDMEAEQPEAGAVPPGYDWPTHGGYLGCILAMMPACLVGGFFGSTFIAWLNKAGIVPPVVAGLLVVALFILCMIGFGRLGWALGRRFYRKYPRSEPSWGEDDAAPSVSAARQSDEPGSQTAR